MPEYNQIEGQCGTCRSAAGFDYGPSPSGPEDGVRCASKAYAEELGIADHEPSLEEFRELGYMLFFRLELLAEEDFRCAHWQPREEVAV